MSPGIEDCEDKSVIMIEADSHDDFLTSSKDDSATDSEFS